MQMLSIEAATQESGLALFRALSAFCLELDDGQGRCFVSVELGTDRRALEVFDSLEAFMKTRAVGEAVSMTVSVEGHDYRLQG